VRIRNEVQALPRPGRPTNIMPVWAMSFSTVAGPNLGQRPTFDPRSSLLWELSTLKVTQGGRRPTAVLNAIGPMPVMGGSVSSSTVLRDFAVFGRSV